MTTARLVWVEPEPAEQRSEPPAASIDALAYEIEQSLVQGGMSLARARDLVERFAVACAVAAGASL